MNPINVIIPGPWWNPLTYLAGEPPAPGARVRVPLGRGTRVGFASGRSAPLSGGAEARKLRSIEEVLDEGEPALGSELWNLAGWIGSAFLCGQGEALQLMCPDQFLQGGPVPRPSQPPDEAERRLKEQRLTEQRFTEIPFYNPIDDERFARYREIIAEGRRTLVLFPEVKTAGAFFASLSKQSKQSKEFKAEAVLWPSCGGKKLWDAWSRTASGEVRVVVGASGAAFAPFPFQEAIVDEESSLAYIFQRAPRISARSIAGRRALVLKARLTLGGRMPSAKTYARSRPEYVKCPERSGFVFVDIKRPARGGVSEARGVEGQLPITQALLERTQAVLERERSALWIMDRKGQAGEVYCSDCGAPLCCPRCNGAARSEGAGNEEGAGNGKTLARIRCVRCGAAAPLPPRCPVCRGTLLLGKKPGLEALLTAAAKAMIGWHVTLDGDKNAPRLPAGPSLILGTRKLLSLCDSLDVGLIAWLDADAEARKADYNARFQAFSMVWESCWRGLSSQIQAKIQPLAQAQNQPQAQVHAQPQPQGGQRLVLMQVRGGGESWRNVLRLGWGHFWKNELREREALGLPPYGLMIQIDLPKNENRKALIGSLEKEGIMVMDSGEENSPLWVAAKSADKLKAALAPRFEIARSRSGFPVVTVWAE